MNILDRLRYREILISRLNRLSGYENHYDKDYMPIKGAMHLLCKNGKYRIMKQNGNIGKDVFSDHEPVSWFPTWLSLKKTVELLEERIQLLEKDN